MPRRHRSHSAEVKRQVVAEYHGGESIHALTRRHDLSRNLIRIWVEIRIITDVFEGYGYRRVDAELRHRGFVVNSKKVRRLMREHDLNPRRRRRFVRTTDSDHDGPTHPFVAREFEVHGPDQLWGEAEQRAFQWKDRPSNDLT